MHIIGNNYYRLAIGENGRIHSLTAKNGDLLAEIQGSVFNVQFRNENGEK